MTKMTNEQTREQDLADAILAMTYAELVAVAQSLRDMNDDVPRNLSDVSDWAELLNSWAESIPAA
jgi:hypothetical protein